MKKAIPCVLFISVIYSIWLLPASCTKTNTKIVTNTLEHAWQTIPNFDSYGSAGLNSVAIGDTQLVVALGYAYISMPVNRSPFNYFSGTFLRGTSLYQSAVGAPYLNQHACAYATSTSLHVSSVPVYSQYSFFSYTPVYTNGAWSIFQQTPSYPTQTWPAASYPVIRNKYVLTPVEQYDTKTARFDLLSFDSAKILSPNGFGDTPMVKRITVTAAPGTPGLSGSGYFCATFYNKFFVFYGAQFFRIDTAGNVKQFGYQLAAYSKYYGIYNMFMAGNTLFANSGGVLFASTDQGETWSVFNDFSQTAVRLLIFRNVGDRLYATVATYESRIWKVAFNGKDLNFSELNNDGLAGNLITSITECGKYVFLTTTGSVFYRLKQDLDQLKKPVRF